MNICIIPARKGSQRIKKKNIKIFNGKPIIYYPIKMLVESNFFDEIIISSDCKKTINIAKKLGAKSYFVRPKYLSGSKVTTKSVIEHAIHYLEKKNKKINIVACAYPTSIFLTKNLIKKTIKILKKKKSDFVFLASKFVSSVERSFLVDKNLKIKKLNLKMVNKNSQDTKDYYYDTGQFMIGYKSSWIKKKNISIISKKSSIVEMNPHNVVDINNLNDWKYAEFLHKSYKKTVDKPIN